MNKQTILTTIVLLVLVCASFGILYFAGTSLVPSVAGDLQQSELNGARAPYFDLPNLTGDHVKLSDFADKPLVLVFWSTWNSQAADQLKILDDYLASGADAHLADVLAIDSQEEQSIVNSFVHRGGYQAPILVDSFGSVSQDYKIKALPTFVFIDRSGSIREVYAGILSAKDIGDKVENLLK